MEEIFIVRHGQADHLAHAKTGGWSDTQLTEVGQQQAENTGEKLQGLLKDKRYKLYCSDLSRARETAEIIGNYVTCKPIIKNGLRELNNGIAANKTREEARLLELPITRPILDWVPYPEAENWNMLYSRVAKCMEEINEDINGTAVIITHANTASAILQWWLDFPKEMFEKITFEIDPCSITHVSITKWNKSKTVNRMNDTGHL